MDIRVTEADVVVVGGGSAGSTGSGGGATAVAAGRVVLLEKAHIKRSGAIAIGMDGLNNAIIPGHATPEQYVKEITVANDGIVNQRAVLEYARNSFAMIQELDSLGREVPEDAIGRFRRQEGPPQRELRPPDARGLRSQEDPDAHGQARRREGRQPGHGDADPRDRRPRRRGDRLRHPGRAYRDHQGEGGHPVLRRLGAARAAGVGLPPRHVREPVERGRRLLDGVPRGRRALGHRVLPGEPAHQGLQRSGVRVRDRPARRAHGQREAGTASSRAITGAGR